MTSTAVGLVLVEGHEADGEIMDQDAFDVPTRRGATAISSSDYVAGAMSRTRAIAHGRHPSAIGVTWSDDSEREASLFLKSLTEAGYQNIVAVRSPEAGEALARGIGRAVGYEQTAVCLLEPEAIVVSVVDTGNGAVQTVEHLDNDIDDGLTRWLTHVFDLNDWDPECLIVVGPETGLDEFTPRLERALGIPVFAPAEAEFALARGAALASAHSPEAIGASAATGALRRRPRSLVHTTALAMLVGGTATFVGSVCLAAGLKLTSVSTESHDTAPPAATPTAPVKVADAAPPPAPAPVEIAPSPVEVVDLDPPPATQPPEEAQQVVDTPPPEEAPAPELPAADGTPPDTPPPPAPEPPAATPEPPPADAPPAP
jgi:hypothetical protein